MSDWRQIEHSILAHGRVNGQELEVLRGPLYAGGKMERREADFLVELHKRGEPLAVTIQATPEVVRVHLAYKAPLPLFLHWGLVWQFRYEWQLPPEDFRPPDTQVFDQKAVRTPFVERDERAYLELEFRKPAEGPAPRGIKFVLYQPEDKVWLKSNGQDLFLPLFAGPAAPLGLSSRNEELIERIVGAERGAFSWTLMHRFNLCYNLLEEVQEDEDRLALLFVWMRYSAVRQLDWQRRYNTKPRNLSQAQDQLTTRLARLWRNQPTEGDSVRGGGLRTWVRLLLTTLGRGEDGQRVRDEILNIMHRHHLKEVSGRFIEEWHQKLHNNTTPDDVAICQAYLAFLRSNGDLGCFYRTLEEAGVTRKRLQSFDRPIRTDPVFDPQSKNVLIGEFEIFLRILKSVHAGTDLETAAAAARSRLDEGPRQKLDQVLALRNGTLDVTDLADRVLEAREGVHAALAGNQPDKVVRDLLFLDLALEEVIRGAIERMALGRLGQGPLVQMIHAALRNINLSIPSKELSVCATHWAALRKVPLEGHDAALHRKSVADRLGRWIQEFTGELYRRLQPQAEFLGQAFEVAPWTVPLFSEEVIRGGPAFALSLLLRHLDPLLRQTAGLGGWQVISPARAAGRVAAVEQLRDVQGHRFPEHTVLVANAVAGDEDLPEGVTAVLTSDTPDLVSHVAVRARNAPILFATCFEPTTYQRLRDLAGRTISLNVTPGGDVEFAEETGAEDERLPGRKAVPAPSSPGPARPFLAWAVTQNQFQPALVGAKANNLNGLRGRLPEWIHLPASIALPFGVFEQVLGDDANHDLRGRYEALLAAAESNPAEVLPEVRALLVRELAMPAPLREALQQACQAGGLPPVSWDQAGPVIRRVWASQWNDRAFFSRRARGISHDSLRMAVLIQQVVEADYAFVLHTVNPLTGNQNEIYAEVVLGLGETLVGNYPGRALGVVCRKADLALQIFSFPGKNLGLYGKGLIFRSDSNGEDLEDFAGAGLYDSFLAEEPEYRVLDYTSERLVWQASFREELVRTIARIGLEVEKVLGTPQDIEGAVAGDRFYVVQARPQVGLGQG